MTVLIALKIFGTILLAVIFLLLLLLLLLLLVPFRYSIDETSHGRKVRGKLKITWFLNGISLALNATSEEVLTGELKLFGYRYLSIFRSGRGIAVNERNSLIPGKEKTAGEELRTEPEETQELPETENIAAADTNPQDLEENKTEEIPGDFPGKQKDCLEVLLRKCTDFIDDLFSKIKTVFKEDLERIRNSSAGFIGKWNELSRILKTEENRKVIAYLKEKLLCLIKEILPRSGSGTVDFGTGDPWTTGKLLEIASILYPVYANVIEVTPYFEEKKLDTDAQISGKISLGQILLILLQVITNRDVNELYNSVRSVIRN